MTVSKKILLSVLASCAFVGSASAMDQKTLDNKLRACRNAAEAEMLLDQGADVNAATKFGTTPLYRACLVCDLPRAKLLMERGANMHAQRADGLTPFKRAVADVKEYLLSVEPKRVAVALECLAKRDGLGGRGFNELSLLPREVLDMLIRDVAGIDAANGEVRTNSFDRDTE